MGYVKVWDPDGIFYHYEITAKGGNDMGNLEKKIKEWEECEKKLRNKIREEKDDHKREYFVWKHTIAINTLERLRDRQWREL